MADEFAINGMSMLSRRQAISRSAGLIGALATGAFTLSGASADPMNRIVRRRIPYGSCVGKEQLQSDADYKYALKTYCEQLTPEGGLFWAYLRSARNQFNFDFADSVLAFAEANEMTMRGHTLVWYGAMPDWTNQIGSAAEAERELTTHIERVVSRYRGRVKTWHVVNEAIDETKGEDVGLRPNIWLKYLGGDYIDMAFRLAHQADPSAELVLNEYNIESMDGASAPRRRALLKLVTDLLSRGVPLHGVGLQGHIPGQYQIDRDGLHDFVAKIASLGLSVHITELDVIDDELPGPIAVRDAVVASRAYDFLDTVFAAVRPSVIATWGITDRYTWVPTWHKRKDGLGNRPLPFDEFYRAKPLWSVIDYFCQKMA
jgi:endo-1,4-beta-xylanase